MSLNIQFFDAKYRCFHSQSSFVEKIAGKGKYNYENKKISYLELLGTKLFGRDVLLKSKKVTGLYLDEYDIEED